jgi:hypothetical protein
MSATLNYTVLHTIILDYGELVMSKEVMRFRKLMQAVKVKSNRNAKITAGGQVLSSCFELWVKSITVKVKGLTIILK